MKFEHAQFPHEEAEALYASVVWGCEPGVRYRYREPLRTGVLPEDHDLILARKDSGELVGAYVISPGERGFLRILLATAPGHRGTGVGEALVQYAREMYVPRLKPGQALWGTIEETNTPSLRLSSKYFPHERQLEVLSITRRFSRRSAEVVHEERENGLHRFELRRSGTFAAVELQAHAWGLETLGDRVSDFVLLPLLPVLLKVSKEDYRFGFFHAWEGEPSAFDELWTHALADQGLTSALVVGDLGDSKWARLKENVRLGLVGWAAGANKMVATSSHPMLDPIAFEPINAL